MLRWPTTVVTRSTTRDRQLRGVPRYTNGDRPFSSGVRNRRSGTLVPLAAASSERKDTWPVANGSPEREATPIGGVESGVGEHMATIWVARIESSDGEIRGGVGRPCPKRE